MPREQRFLGHGICAACLQLQCWWHTQSAASRAALNLLLKLPLWFAHRWELQGASLTGALLGNVPGVARGDDDDVSSSSGPPSPRAS